MLQQPSRFVQATVLEIQYATLQGVMVVATRRCFDSARMLCFRDTGGPCKLWDGEPGGMQTDSAVPGLMRGFRADGFRV